MRARRLRAAALAGLGALLMGLLAAPGAQAATSVLETTFCLKRPGAACAEPVGDRSSVTLAQLPQDGNGRRVIYFFSRLRLETGRVAFVVIERVGSCYGKGSPKLYVSPRLRTQGWASFWGEVSKRLADFSLSPQGQGFLAVGIAAPLGPKVPQNSFQDVHAFGEREMNCAGKILARVLDFEGKPMPGDNELKELAVTP